jgi:uncharacterized membrane protein
MKRAILFFIALITLALNVQKANAGLFLCNATSERVYVAIGYQENGQWLSRGWWAFQPTECNSLYLGVPQTNISIITQIAKAGKRFGVVIKTVMEDFFVPPTMLFITSIIPIIVPAKLSNSSTWGEQINIGLI